MFIAFLILVISIAAIPAFAIADVGMILHIITLLGVMGLMLAASAAGASEVTQASQILKPIWLFTSLPALWMVFQIVPMPIHSLSASIWQSASAALSEKLLDHISINLGNTTASLFQYASALAFMTMIVLVCQDRRRAEQTLFALCIVATLTSLVLLIVGTTTDTLTAISSIGIVLDLAAAVRAFERYESRRAGAPDLARSTIFKIAACIGGTAVCAVAIVLVARTYVRDIAFIAVALFAAIEVVRRFDRLPRLILLPCLIAVALAAVTAVWSHDPAVPYVLQFADLGSSSIAATENMLAEARWTGSGAGTFAALLAIYGGATFQAPTMAAQFVVEFGLPMTLVMIAAVVWLILILLRGALLRGRDSFYPAAAAACATIMLGLAFCNVSLSQSSVVLLVEVVVGLGLAQRISSTG